MIAPDISASTALKAVLAAPDLAAAQAAARAGLDRLADDAPLDVMDVTAAAELVHRTPSTVRRWCAERGIGHRWGGQWVVIRRKLVALVEGDR